MAAIHGVDMRTGTALRVVSVGKKKGFRLGIFCIDELSPYDLLSDPPARKVDKESLTLIRSGRRFDAGTVEEFGTHGRSHYFHGLLKAAADAQRAVPTVIVGNLKAAWFIAGDILHVSAKRRDVTEHIRENWLEQLRRSRRFAKLKEEADKSFTRLRERAATRGQMLDFSDKQSVYGWARDHTRAYARLEERISRVPLPALIRWKYPHSVA